MTFTGRTYFIAVFLTAVFFLISGYIYDKCREEGMRPPELREICRDEFNQRRPCTDTDFVITVFPREKE